MKLTADFHTHTKFSHGKGTILENAQVAKERGLKIIGISDHGFSHPIYSMKRRKIPIMKQQCKEAQQITGVEVKLGIESNILGIDGKTDLKVSDYDNFDLFLAGIHRFIFYDKISEWFKLLGANAICNTFKKSPDKKLIDRNTKVYINSIKNNPIDILTHVNFLIFADPVEVAKCCYDYGTLLEINSKKTHLSDEEWQKVIETGVNFVIDSDAHKPENVGKFDLVDKLLNRVEFPKDRILNIDGNLPNNMRFMEFKKRL